MIFSFSLEHLFYWPFIVQDTQITVTQVMGTGGGMGGITMTNEHMASKLAAVSATIVSFMDLDRPCLCLIF